MKAEELRTIESLVERSGIDRGRWYRWFGGKSIPRRSTLRKIAVPLGLTYEILAEPWGELIDAAGAGTGPESGIHELTAMVGDLVALLRPIVLREVDREARLRAIEAELQSLRAQPAGEGSPGRSTRPATAG